MLPGHGYNLFNLCFRDFIGVDTAYADLMSMHGQHDFNSFVFIFFENPSFFCFFCMYLLFLAYLFKAVFSQLFIMYF